MKLPKPTHEHLRAVIKHRGWTQRELSRRLGLLYDAVKGYCSPPGKNATPIPAPKWQLVLLLADLHPAYALVPRSQPLPAELKEIFGEDA